MTRVRPFIHQVATACTLCDISHMVKVKSTGIACEIETSVPSDCQECFVPDQKEVTCVPHSCQSGDASGQWVEVASGDAYSEGGVQGYTHLAREGQDGDEVRPPPSAAGVARRLLYQPYAFSKVC